MRNDEGCFAFPESRQPSVTAVRIDHCCFRNFTSASESLLKDIYMPVNFSRIEKLDVLEADDNLNQVLTSAKRIDETIGEIQGDKRLMYPQDCTCKRQPTTPDGLKRMIPRASQVGRKQIFGSLRSPVYCLFRWFTSSNISVSSTYQLF